MSRITHFQATVAAAVGFCMFGLANIAYAAEEAGGISVHLDPYIVGHLFGVPITATLITAWVTMLLLIGFSFLIYKNMKLIPGKLQSVTEMVIGYIYDFMKDTLESEELARRYFPIVATIFIFVLSLNWIGLLPGVTAIGRYETHEGVRHLIPFLYPAATDLNITIAFTLVAFVTIEVAGVLALGVWKYAGKFINFSGHGLVERLLNFVIGLIELISELARLIAFSFRLFGNIFAGKVLLLIVIFFVPYLLPVPFMGYELFVGFIQAFIFAILTLFFIKIAVTEPEH